jgi:hypothetical protein
MVKRFFYLIFTIGFLITTGISCSEDISDCPSHLCIMAGGWRLVDVEVDDEKSTEDFSMYKLTLNDPSPTTAVNSSFERITTLGLAEDGVWSLANYDPDRGVKGASLRLIPDNNTERTEDWVIESMTPRELVLVLTRDTGAKEGPGKIRFVLVPF